MSSLVPEHCPGTQSDQAGKASACAGCPNQSICASGEGQVVDPSIAQIAARLTGISKKILVLSGKGGVGKSTVAATLAFHASGLHESATVGVLDVDVTGPSLPRLLGCNDDIIQATSSGWTPVYVDENLCCMSIAFMLPSKEHAVIWRGPKKNGIIKQFLRDVDWGPLDLLVVDTPPGTSDEHLAIVTYLNDAGIDGAVLVTTPQEVALQDVRKEIQFCRKVGVRILGVIENMSGFVCPSCTHVSEIFEPTTGGARQLCKDMDVPFLGSIPLDPRIAMSCDSGIPFMQEFPDSPATQAYSQILNRLYSEIEL